jgi:Flp pilus assembly protein TadD
MKRFLPLVVVFLGLIASARAQGPDEQYIQIYNVMQQAEGLKESGQDNAALQKYLEAESSLRKFKRIYPDWNPRIVEFRLKYLAARIGPLTEQKAPSLDVELTAPSRPGESAGQPAVDYATRVEDLESRVRDLESEKVVLESKLKEALSVQPAVIDPAELERTRERISGLTEENSSLKSELEAAREQAAQKVDPSEVEQLNTQLAEANRKLAEQLEIASTLQQEKQLLQQQLESTPQTTGADSEALESLRTENEHFKRLLAETEQRQSTLIESTQRELESAKRRIEEQNATITRLQSQPGADQTAGGAVDREALNSLRSENRRLKQQIAEISLRLQSAQAQPSSTGATGDAAAEIAALKSNLEILQLEKTALQNRVRTLSASPVATTSLPPAQSPETAQRIRQLETEKQELETKLQAASRELYGSDARTQQRVQQMADQMANLRARLEILEARRVPYTEEELALMKKPEPALAAADSAANKQSINEMPRGTADLVAQAQRAFSSGNYAEAEQKYLQVLERDPNNVYTLGNLAAIQLEQGKTAEAEANLIRALGVQPEDAFCLSLLGYLNFQENKLDEALDALGRSAKIDPQSAETQNYLGIVLSHKGFRGPAETALRRAIQLKPNYASAHNNLAVIYVTQTPPMVELARWHYQKALANGHPSNQELDSMIEKAGGAPVGR